MKKGGITVGFVSVLLGLAIISVPVFFIKRWSDGLWEERSLAVKNMLRENQNFIANDIGKRIVKCAPNTSCSQSLFPFPGQAATFDGTGNASAGACPLYFNWIRQDLKPWAHTGISLDMLEAAKKSATFRLTIVNGRMYVERYRKSFQTRDIFTFWGIAQLLKFYPRKLPDLDLMFNCDDKPVIRRAGYKDPAKPPPALFHYCGSEETFDIAFPDWSFWGWPEIMTPPWEPLVKDIQAGSQKIKWENRDPSAYWKGNPYTGWRRQLLKCHKKPHWNGHIYIQDWGKESRQAFRESKLADQCHHRGLVPQQHYWPVRADKVCDSIQFAVNWGNTQTEEAKGIGEAGKEFILNELKMSNVYDYMFHVLNEYSKLLKYKPSVPAKASEYCSESLFRSAKNVEQQYMEESIVTTASSTPPCKLDDPEYEEKYVEELFQWKTKMIATIKHLEESAKAP